MGWWPGFSGLRLVRWSGVLIWTAAVVLGLLSEGVAFGWEDVANWLPDLVVGLVFVGCGVHAASRSWGTAVLMVAVGASWFLGNVWGEATYLHRGVLAHLLVAYPGWRPRSRLDVAAIVAGYLAAVVAAVWRLPAALVLFAALLVVVGRSRVVAAGRVRIARRVAFAATVAWCAAVVAGAVARSAVGELEVPLAIPLLYQAVLCGIAILLTACLPSTDRSSVVDLVVELGEGRSGTLRDAFASTLGDPSLEIGYWDGRDGYRDAEGRVVVLPSPGARRAVTYVDGEAEPVAVLVHDGSVLGEPLLVESVVAATRLSSVNAELQAVVNSQIAELTASRRRLVVAADRERRNLDERLRTGAERRLANLQRVLRREVCRTDCADDGLDDALVQLAQTIEDLHQLAAGLHPRELDKDLVTALHALGARTPLLVTVAVHGDPGDGEVATAVYYVCAEALSNAAKHSAGASATVDVTRSGDRIAVEVTDDGVGGADITHGSGLRGLRDRVEALGGTMRINSSPGGVGTRLTAALPVTSIGAES